ncbi:TPA: MFS transporter [Escherichia coli]|nr:MFS transporter [Escherichia coli]EJH8447013.1 MFS transporter [Escherichia coli]EJW5857119.1 MFS transporter [Escherichia coli]HBA9179990.1 MFS transporter [Escherichia coli]
MMGRCLFGFSGEKPFLLPDNEGVKMNTSPVRMDDLPLNRFHCRIAALTFGAHLTDGYVLGVIGYAIIQLTPAMQLTPFMAGMIGGSALLGLFLGSLVLGWISDHIGRQKIFTFSFLLITLASFLQFFATTPEHLIGLRILIGIGLGGDYSVGHTLLAEFSPRRHRGVLLGAFSVVWTVGYVLASIAGHHFISESPEAWRWLLASAAMPALLITLLRWGTPESPRWLLRQGRFAEAHAIVHRYFGPHVLLGDEVATATHKHIKTLFSSRYWRRTAFNSVFFVCLVIPWFVIYTWLPTIAQTIGLEDALTASLMLNALLIVGALLGLVLTHLLAHRKFLLGSFLLLAATLVVMACLPSGSSLTLLLFVLFSTTISAVSNLVGILPAESFPTDIRSLGVGFATAMSRLGAAVSTGLLPWVLAQWGMQVTLLILAAVLLVGFVVTWLWAPETKALPLVAAGNVGGANEQAAAALLLAQRKNGTPMSLTALSMGDERALHWLRYLMALGFEEAVLLETAADLRFASEFVARHIAEWQRQNPLDLIITGCQSSEGQNGQTPFLLAEMLGWPCFTQVERFTLNALFITLEQRTEHGLRCCRVRLPAVIAVRQCGEVALPVPGMRQRMAAGKAEIIRKTVAAELPAMQCLQLARAAQRRGATLIDGQTVAGKAQKLWQDYLRQRMQP